MKTVKEVLALSTSYLAERGISEPRRASEELVSHVLGIKRLEVYMDIERPLEERELEGCRAFLERLGRREPWQYIVGHVDFCRCRIAVNPHVLIPRQETEVLVERVIKELRAEKLEGKSLWDVCGGSGCIGIAIKKALPVLNVVISDNSAKALAVAVNNADSNGVDVEFRYGDLLAPFEGESADFVVCNPPYIADKEMSSLEAEVAEFEPRSALVAGVLGTEFYQRLAADLKGKLKADGRAWLEIGSDQGRTVSGLFHRAGWSRMSVERDWSGHDRFFFLES